MQTIIPLEQTIGACSPIKPEWLRLPDAMRMSGLGRSTLYSLIGTRSIKSAVLRKRGNARGRRLINSDSLLKYIESFVEGGDGQ
jgi:hypothetical protein